jgi:hypothetical protein
VPPDARFVSDATLRALERSLIVSTHADEVAELEMVEEAIKYVEPVISDARKHVQAGLGINEPQFEQRASAEGAKEIRWLKQINGEMRVISEPRARRLRRTWRMAGTSQTSKSIGPRSPRLREAR